MLVPGANITKNKTESINLNQHEKLPSIWYQKTMKVTYKHNTTLQTNITLTDVTYTLTIFMQMNFDRKFKNIFFSKKGCWPPGPISQRIKPRASI